jgi:trehalose 6-phosphate synthase/phosphatase
VSEEETGLQMQSLDASQGSSLASSDALMEGMDLAQQPYRLVVVTNREPYEVKQTDSELILKRTAGGLVSALDPVLRETKGMWICWEGTRNKIAELEQTQNPHQMMNLEELSDANEVTLPYDIKVVPLTDDEINHYYYGYANTRLWPRFHYFPDKCDFSDENDWTSYYSANLKFATKVVAETVPEDLIWVHDYQLFLVPGLIRKEAPDRHVGFFCHIPFPDYEIFRTGLITT